MDEPPIWSAVFFLAYGGFALLALSQERHWSRVSPSIRPQDFVLIAQRAVGLIAIVAGLPLCAGVEGASFGSLLWTFLMSAAAAALALTLSWAAGLLVPLAWAIGFLHRGTRSA